MTHHKHQHDHEHHGNIDRLKRKIHKDWRLWVVVGLMLLSMVVYLLTMDDSWQLFR